jgi:hypothetical protein
VATIVFTQATIVLHTVTAVTRHNVATEDAESYFVVNCQHSEGKSTALSLLGKGCLAASSSRTTCIRLESFLTISLKFAWAGL